MRFISSLDLLVLSVVCLGVPLMSFWFGVWLGYKNGAYTKAFQAEELEKRIMKESYAFAWLLLRQVYERRGIELPDEPEVMEEARATIDRYVTKETVGAL